MDFLPYYPILRYLVDAGCPIENALNSYDMLHYILFSLMYYHSRNISCSVTRLAEIGLQITDNDLLLRDVGAFRSAFIHSEECRLYKSITLLT